MPLRVRVAAWICVAVGAIALAAVVISTIREGHLGFDAAVLLLPAGFAILQGHGPSRRWVLFFLGLVVSIATALTLLVMYSSVVTFSLAGLEVETPSQALMTLVALIGISFWFAWALYSRPARDYFAQPVAGAFGDEKNAAGGA